MVKSARPDSDAFGHALMDRLEGNGDPVEIIERDDGFIALSTRAAAYFGGPADWAGWIARRCAILDRRR